MASEKLWYVYLLRCRDGTYYTGVTTDVERRIKQHNNGTGAKYTRGRLPVMLVWSERQTSHSSALKREAIVKRLRRPEKIILVGPGV